MFFLDSVLVIILFYNKEAVPLNFCSHSEDAFDVAATGAETSSYNYLNVSLWKLFIFIIGFVIWKFLFEKKSTSFICLYKQNPNHCWHLKNE